MSIAKISKAAALLIYGQKHPARLLLDDSQSGVRDAQSDGGPVLLSCRGQEALYGSVYDVHT